MQKLQMKLENCYGIQKMNECIDYASKNVAVVYAPNGTMKSSLAKTFEAIRDKKEVEERVFGYPSSCNITDENNAMVSAEKIIVINPFDENVYENQGLLIANEMLRKQYIDIHKSIEGKKEKLYSLLKTVLRYSSRSSFDVKDTLLHDWKYKISDEYMCLEEILELIKNKKMKCVLSEKELDYSALFNDKVYAVITTGKTSELLAEYEKKYDELVEKSLYMQKGIIDHNNYGNISNVLGGNGFFNAKNEITLRAKDGSSKVILKEQKELDELINAEKDKVLNTKEIKEVFEQINKVLCKNKDTQAFNLLLQNKPELISEYKDIDLLKKKVWVKAFSVYVDLLQELLAEYKKAKEDLAKLRKKAKKETTDWEKALFLFKERFYVPFQIEISNQEDVILNKEMPSFKYTFKDSRGEKEVTKEGLLDVLSTGERRAYYILNMIFQVLVAKREDKENLLILDDISESFDYKNKYAIIEYICDIADFTNSLGKKCFQVLILTHNFDFYRTVASRITKRSNSYIAFSDDGVIRFEKGHYTKNIFVNYKERLSGGNCDNIFIASIPFIRNIIEYTEGVSNGDYILLTSVLHNKKDTKNISMKHVEDIFNKYWFKGTPLNYVNGRENELVYDVIMCEADKIIDTERIEIENKIILAMAIRLRAESYIRQKILTDVPGGNGIISDIELQTNQSARLINAYKEYVNDNVTSVLEVVAMITPENIHLNSFMFEPILDMSLKHLYSIYHVVKTL